MNRYYYLTPAEIQVLELSLPSFKDKPFLLHVIKRILNDHKYEKGDIVRTQATRKHPIGSYGEIVDACYDNEDILPNVCVRFSQEIDDTEHFNVDEVELIYRKRLHG